VRQRVHFVDAVVVPIAPALFCLPLVEHDVHCHAVQPGAERRVPAELPQLLPRPDKHILREFLGPRPPASTLVQVVALAHPDWLIEVEAIAVV